MKPKWSCAHNHNHNGTHQFRCRIFFYLFLFYKQNFLFIIKNIALKRNPAEVTFSFIYSSISYKFYALSKHLFGPNVTVLVLYARLTFISASPETRIQRTMIEVITSLQWWRWRCVAAKGTKWKCAKLYGNRSRNARWTYIGAFWPRFFWRNSSYETPVFDVGIFNSASKLFVPSFNGVYSSKPLLYGRSVSKFNESGYFNYK